jgi:hypothetical protein
MRAVTEDATIVCAHRGNVDKQPSQSLVTVAGRRLLVEPDPIGRSIGACPNSAPPMKKCATTLSVRAGYSTLVRIDGHAVVLDSLAGLTDGTPPGVVEFSVADPGQQLVAVAS